MKTLSQDFRVSRVKSELHKTARSEEPFVMMSMNIRISQSVGPTE
jgi:hypothetical protein